MKNDSFEIGKTDFFKSNKPSPKILELIDLANILPPKIEMPSLAELCQKVLGGAMPNRLENEDDSGESKFAPPQYISALKILWATILRKYEKHPALIDRLQKSKQKSLDFYNLPGAAEVVRKPTHNPSEKFWHYEDALTDYRNIREWRRKIYSIARHARAFYENDFSLFAETSDEYFPPYPSYLSIKNDRIVFEKDPVAKVFEGIDARRIRLCETCEKVFWAYRLNNFTCSRKCADARRQRNYRTKKNQKTLKQEEGN